MSRFQEMIERLDCVSEGKSHKKTEPSIKRLCKDAADFVEAQRREIMDLSLAGLRVWFDCRDRLPTHGVDVLLYQKGDERIVLGWWDKEHAGTSCPFIKYDANGTKRIDASHWMLLPQIPEAQQ